MICLITSEDFGDKRDSKDIILNNTISSLPTVIMYDYGKKFISPKFNSGLFGVPWEETEKILKKLVDDNNLDWDVYSMI